MSYCEEALETLGLKAYPPKYLNSDKKLSQDYLERVYQSVRFVMGDLSVDVQKGIILKALLSGQFGFVESFYNLNLGWFLHGDKPNSTEDAFMTEVLHDLLKDYGYVCSPVVVDYICDNFPVKLDYVDEDGVTLIKLAMACKSTDIPKCLIEHGAKLKEVP